MDVIELFIFDRDINVIGTATPIELQHTEEARTLFAQIPGDVAFDDGYSVGFWCIDSRFRIFEVSDWQLTEPEGYIQINAIDKTVRELMDDPITDLRPRDTTIDNAVSRLIAGTQYTLGVVSCTNTGSMTAYYVSVWDALQTAQEAFDCVLVPYFEFNGGQITARKIDILSRLGNNRGRVFELGDDLAGVRVKYDDSQIKTALYGRGRGVEIESDTAEDPTFGRRLTFADVEWSTASGDPVDKPSGQEWVGDPDALDKFGRDGRHRFGFLVFENEEDPEKLLQETWDALQELVVPRITIEATVMDTERAMGRSHEAVRLGDDVLIRMEKKGIDIEASVVGVVRDYIRPEETKLTIGNAAITAGGIMKKVQQTLDNYAGKSAVWDRANAFDLQGAMDVMNNQILSTSGGWYTDPDTGAIMLVSEDGTKAMRLTGAGWQIAPNKTGDAWNWRTAATGSGIVADQITTGTLNAGLVTVGGTGTTLDGTSLTVMHPTISSTAKTIIDAGGLKMMNAGTVLGGLLNLDSTIVSAVQVLYNPTFANYKIDIGAISSSTLSDSYGLKVSRGGTEVLGLGADTSGAEINAVGRRLNVAADNVYIYGDDTWIRAGNDGEIYFHFKNPSGYYVTHKISAIVYPSS